MKDTSARYLKCMIRSDVASTLVEKYDRNPTDDVERMTSDFVSPLTNNLMMLEYHDLDGKRLERARLIARRQSKAFAHELAKFLFWAKALYLKPSTLAQAVTEALMLVVDDELDMLD